MLAVRIRDLAAELGPTKTAVAAPPEYVGEPATAADVLRSLIESLANDALTAQSAGEFVAKSRSILGTFNGLMTALAEVASDSDMLSPDDVADEAGFLGEEWTEAMRSSIASLRRGWAVRARLISRSLTSAEVEELHFFGNCILWNVWALTSVASIVRRKGSVHPEVLEALLLLLRRTAREGFAALRALELAHADQTVEVLEHADDPEVDALEAEAQMQADEAMAEIESDE